MENGSNPPQRLITRHNKGGTKIKSINFKDSGLFSQLEEQAIDGNLDYSDFPPEEYKYFSKLAKLGYNNRHKGWSVEICLDKQEDYKKQYLSEKERNEWFYKIACKMQDNIRKGEMMISEVYKAKNEHDKLIMALNALELITCEDGLMKRSMKMASIEKGAIT